MKRYLIMLVCGVWIVGAVAPVLAVEKKEKSATTQAAPKKGQSTAKRPTVNKGKAAPKYDDFVDKNKNGIDDRKETTKIKDDQRVKPKAEEKKDEDKKTDEKKPG